ncbi:hypothetical protein [Streptomyces sp. CNQ085]|nr:hypothetical protein [Streptomyces sp. CNQ085]
MLRWPRDRGVVGEVRRTNGPTGQVRVAALAVGARGRGVGERAR